MHMRSRRGSSRRRIWVSQRLRSPRNATPFSLRERCRNLRRSSRRRELELHRVDGLGAEGERGRELLTRQRPRREEVIHQGARAGGDPAIDLVLRDPEARAVPQVLDRAAVPAHRVGPVPDGVDPGLQVVGSAVTSGLRGGGARQKGEERGERERSSSGHVHGSRVAGRAAPDAALFGRVGAAADRHVAIAESEPRRRNGPCGSRAPAGRGYRARSGRAPVHSARTP